MPNGDIVAVGEHAEYNSDGLIMRLNIQGEMLWSFRYGGLKHDKLQRIKRTADGGFISCGYTESLSAKTAMLVVKFTAAGQVSWSAAFSAGSDNGERAADITQTADGGYAVVATFNAYMHAPSDVLVCKLSATGSLQWSKKFNGGESDWATGVASVADGILVSGYHNTTATSSHNSFLMKLNSADGSVLWGKSYDRNNKDDRFTRLEAYAGGFLMSEDLADDRYFSYQRQAATMLDADGNVVFSRRTTFNTYVQGTVMYQLTTNNGIIGIAGNENLDPRIFKLDANGNIEWKRSLPKYGDQRLFNIMQTRDGSYTALGLYSTDFYISYDAYVIKLSEDGKTTGCVMDTMALTISDAAPSVQPLNWTSASNATLNILNTNSFLQNELYQQVNELCRYTPCQQPSPNCLTTYQKSYGGGGDDEAFDIIATTDRGSLMCGRTTSGTAGDQDGFLLKLDQEGQIQWSKKYGGNQNDELHYLIKLSDGNYLSAGVTRSFGHAAGALWVMKTDASGNVIWSRQYTGNGRERAKKIIELSGGQLLIAGSTNDSTVQNNAWLLQLTATGNVIWSKQYDQGNNDGFRDVLEEGDTLIVAGYVTIDKKDGVLAKLRKSDGGFIWGRKFVVQPGWDDELVNVHRVPEGYAFGASAEGIGYRATMFKMRPDGHIFYQARVNVSTASGYRVESLKMIASHDTGFVYLANDTTPRGYPFVAEVNLSGNPEWGKSFWDSYNQRMHGLSLGSGRGFLLAGYFSSFNTNNKRRIKVLRTDELGRMGVCVQNGMGTMTDTVHYSITPFTWSSITDYSLAESGAVSVQVFDYPLDITTDCAITTCDSTQQMNDSCSKTFKLDITTTARNIIFPMGIRTPDGGYMLAGEHGYGGPGGMVARLSPNGSLQWAKQFNDFRHHTSFHTLVNTADGNVIALGMDAYLINHGISDSILLLKINYAGDVLWIKKFSRGRNARIKPTPDGGFILIINASYGNPPIYNYIVKLDPNGNIVWQKESLRYTHSSMIRDVIIDGSFMYTVGDFYLGVPDNNIEVIKFDLNTGQVLYCKRHIASDKRGTSAQRAFLTQDTLYIATVLSYQPTPYTYGTHCGIVKLNPQTGLVYSALEITAPHLTGTIYYPSDHGARPYIIDRTPDSGFVFTNQSGPLVDSGLVIGKLSKDGTLAWMKHYPGLKATIPFTLEADGDHLLISGTTSIPMDPRRIGTFIRTDSLGNIKEGVAQGDCYNQPINGSVVPLPMDTSWRSFTNYVNSTTVRSTPFVPYITDISVQVKASCAVPGNCAQLLLNGPDTVCNFTDTIVFSSQRNAGCTNAVNWIADTSYATILFRTDSTIAVRFKKPGQSIVRAQLNSGCQVITRNKTIIIPPPAAQISLGADKTICPGNQVTLRAAPGYHSYQWQDGSTDSVLVVTQPGTYHVRVTDICNRWATDTIEVKAAAPFTVELGPDIAKCDTQSVILSAPAGYARYSWSPAYQISSLTAVTVTVRPDTTTRYRILVERADGCKTEDSILVTVHRAPPVYLGSDTSFCSGQFITLDAGNSFTKYLWNTGDTTRQITVQNKGRYHVLAADINNCLSRDEIEILNVHPLPAINIGKDTFLCEQGSYIFDAGNFISYRWQDGSAARTFTTSQVGKYWVSVTDANLCSNADTASILRIAPLPQQFADTVVEFCQYDKATLVAKGNFVKYRWSTGSATASIEVKTPGRYWLEVTNADGCTHREYIDVRYKQCKNSIDFPNAFTPNNDRRHDAYKPIVRGTIIKYRFTIYNRWGQRVFETSQPADAWDGTVAGRPQDSGTFAWYCEYQFPGEEVKTAKGVLVLIR